MNSAEWEQAARLVLAELADSHLQRHRRVIAPLDATHVRFEGRTCVNFASNNYLGLTHHPRVIAAYRNSVEKDGAGSGASALITGYGPPHAEAERHLARWKGTEAAVLLPSGYQANHAAVQALAAVAERSGRPIRFLLDKLAHASLIDAVRGTGAPYRVFPHNHLPKLRRLLDAAEPGQVEVVVTESIFSMDGDAADLRGLADLKSARPFLLLLDDAHASGVYGPGGSGLASELGLSAVADVTVITLSKAIGCGGGAVCGSRAFCDAMVNLARAYVYSTSLPPGAAAGADAALSVMESEPWHQERLRGLAGYVRKELGRRWAIPPGDSPIIPLVTGSESSALAAADALLERHLIVLAIRPPTVARGTSRLRLTLSSAHTDAQIEQLLQALRDVHPQP